MSSSLPSLFYREIVRALQRDGWVIVRQRGSHVRLHKRTRERTLKLTVPAHRPVKHSTLRRILRQAELDVDRFLRLLSWSQHNGKASGGYPGHPMDTATVREVLEGLRGRLWPPWAGPWAMAVSPPRLTCFQRRL